MSNFQHCQAVRITGCADGVYRDPQAAATALKSVGVDVILPYETWMDAGENYTIPVYHYRRDGAPDYRYAIESWDATHNYPMVDNHDPYGKPTDGDDGEPTSGLARCDLEAIDRLL